MSANALICLVQDRLITDEQVDMLYKLAREFASLNELPAEVRRGSERLLENSKKMVAILESRS